MTHFNKITVSRRVALIAGLLFWPVLLPLLHGLAPRALSSLTYHHGWINGRPGIWNALALIPVVAAAAGFIWTLVLHFLRIPERMEVELTPKYLLKGGPYTFTRNPMYLAVLMIWLGWTLFYGSVAVFMGWLLLWSVLTLVVVPWEERNLEARFGEDYLQYKKTVSRWIGRIRGRGQR